MSKCEGCGLQDGDIVKWSSSFRTAIGKVRLLSLSNYTSGYSITIDGEGGFYCMCVHSGWDKAVTRRACTQLELFGDLP